MGGRIGLRFRRVAPLPVVVAALLVPSAASTPDRPHAGARDKPGAVAGELIVGFERGVARSEHGKALGRAKARKKRDLPRIDAALVTVAPGDEERAIAELERDPRVRFAEPNFVLSASDHAGVPNDPSFHQLWGLDNFGQLVNGVAGLPDADIDAQEAWGVTTGSRDVVVGVIDTGVDFGHPDLAPQQWTNPGESCAGCRTDGRDNDGNGYVDDWRGWDFANDDDDPFDDNGHGTHVAGTVGAAGNNGVGVAGVNWTVSLMGLKFLAANGSGTTADAVQAVLYATAMGADVTNNSYGGDGFSQALSDAIAQADAAGSLFVTAAGNSASDLDAAPSYPASYRLPNVVTVAATEEFDGRAWFSNYGKRSVDLGAPGTDVFSTWPGGRYVFSSGTSMASPHVAGAAALVEAAFPDATAVGIRALLLRTVDPNGALSGRTVTGGRLNVDRAVRCAGAPTLTLDSPPDGFEPDVGQPVAVTAVAAQCASPSGVTVSATANGVPFTLAPRGDGLYSGSFTPTQGGAVTVSVSASAGGTTQTRTVSGIATQSSPITAGGPPVTVSTTVANQNARAVFQGAAGRRVALKLSSVSIGTSTCCSAKVSILRADGQTVVPATWFGTSGAFVDAATLPDTGSYTILVDPQGTATGSATLTLYDVPPDATVATAPGGPPVTVTTTAPGQNAKATFQGTAGQRVSVKLSSVTIGTSTCCSTKVTILRTDGSNLVFPSWLGTSGGFVDATTLPTAGTYAVLVDPQGTDSGSATVTLYDVPADASAPASPGGPAVTLATTAPGQNAVATFAGTAGQRVSVKVTDVTIGTSTCCSARVSMLRPDGTTLVFATYVGRSGGFLDTATLPAAGTYAVLVDPQGTDVGSATLTLYDVPVDAAATLGAGGPDAAVVTSVPGQNARATFAGAAGQRVSLKLSAVTVGTSTCCAARVSLLRPDGSTLVAASYVGTSGGFVDTTPLPAAGTYTVLVDPQGPDTGSMTLTLYDVPPDPTVATVVGGAPVTVIAAVPGQNPRATFPGAAGQRVNVKLSNVTLGLSACCSTRVSVLRPDGSSLVFPTWVGTAGATLGATLPASGTYTVLVDPQGATAGSATLTVAEATALAAYVR